MVQEEAAPAGAREDVKSAANEEKPDTSLMICTKLSTEELIYKTPQESLKLDRVGKSACFGRKTVLGRLLCVGILQMLFGMLMTVFGVLVLVYNARLAQLGAGLWGGFLAIASGMAGVLATAENCCPLKSNPHRIVHTLFLALSLINVATSQLVLVLTATGLARDLSYQNVTEAEKETITAESNLPANYLAILSNIGLIVASTIECVCTAIASYQSAKMLCPCFKRHGDIFEIPAHSNYKEALVNSWLGKHSLSPPLYVVAASASLERPTKFPNALTIAPVMPLPPPMLSPPPSIIGYPLIPAPLGPVPSPIIHPDVKGMLHRKHRRHHSMEPYVQNMVTPRLQPKRSRSKPRERPVTTEDVVRTYTGLDRAIAEEFIDICDSRNNSISNESSCQSGCSSSGYTSFCNNGCDLSLQAEKC